VKEKMTNKLTPKRVSDDYIIRFSFEITKEQKARADKLLGSYGIRRKIFSVILDDILDLIEEEGNVALGILVSGTLKPRQVLPHVKKAEEGAKKING
jgi:hypothetical protein